MQLPESALNKLGFYIFLESPDIRLENAQRSDRRKKAPQECTKIEDRIHKPYMTLSQVSAQLKRAFPKYENDDSWLKNCISDLHPPV
jgi:hypothetical protein